MQRGYWVRNCWQWSLSPEILFELQMEFIREEGHAKCYLWYYEKSRERGSAMHKTQQLRIVPSCAKRRIFFQDFLSNAVGIPVVVWTCSPGHAGVIPLEDSPQFGRSSCPALSGVHGRLLVGSHQGGLLGVSGGSSKGGQAHLLARSRTSGGT